MADERTVLAFDVGGTHVKLLASTEQEHRRFDSGPKLTPAADGRRGAAVNDAVMQAIGSYQGGRMLFLGLGTGLGSALIVDGVVEPLELGHLPFKKKTFEDYVSTAALEKRGKKRWRKSVFEVVERLSKAMEPDYVVIGGGGAADLDELPPGSRRGDNDNAFSGGFRLWDPVWQPRTAVGDSV